ncbi:transcriptional regulator [Streptomyces sp. XM4193]|uniref:AfsR/SARP family transcriptional regulator n=1 Tax=Streptomyces sp. XM4193 TaxID=2929782 RepID=UPI001FF7B11C|nr:transcriptional regulator [Streptomyces sp. XM4193]MCK1794773.1 transcriptional regulator [Streptomyces sp. XM4193]
MDVPAGRLRVLLVSLALRAGSVVSIEEISERLWGIDPPSGARATVRTYVKRLRRVLDGSLRGSASVISSEYGGYRLRREAVVVDVDRFRTLTARAANAPDRRSEAEFLDAALQLWRGEALSGVVSRSLATTVAPAMEEQRLTALHRRVVLRLQDGAGAGEELPLLREILAKDPYQERFWALLIQALHAAGRQAEALREYGRCREVLADGLGADPGAELRALHRSILAGDPAPPPPARRSPQTDAPAQEPARSSLLLPAPMQLPPDISSFVGRAAELATLTALSDPGGTAGSLTVVDGPPGVGKTGFAVHWAHRHRADYPDGRLYADLQGYGAKDSAQPADVLRSFLLGLGVPAEEVPDREESRSALLRSLLAGRRMLVVLDNVRCGEQVRPLLPGGASTVLVTSRNQMRGLVAGDGAFRLTLPPLPAPAAAELLRRLTPPPHAPFARHSPAELAELAELCWRLPLTLRTVAERLERRPEGGPARLVAEIREAGEPLSVLGGSESRTDMRTVLSWSVEALTPDAAGLFRRLCAGARAGATLFTAADVAALLAVPPERAERLLDELAEQHLLAHHRCGEYGLILPVGRSLAVRQPLTA